MTIEELKSFRRQLKYDRLGRAVERERSINDHIAENIKEDHVKDVIEVLKHKELD